MRLSFFLGFLVALQLAAVPGLAQAAPTVSVNPTPQPREVPAGIPDENILNLDLTTGGRVVIVLRPDLAPNHVERIRTLANQGFYDGVLFHRVIPGLMAQTGDPKGDGTGGSELPDLKAEFSKVPHLRGTVSMARAGDPDSANSQFFIVFQPYYRWDGEYTVFGRVFDGMPYVDAIAPGEPPRTPDRIVQARIGRNVPFPSAEAVAAANAAPAARANAAPQSDRSIEDLLTQAPEGASPSPDAPADAPAAATDAASQPAAGPEPETDLDAEAIPDAGTPSPQSPGDIPDPS